MKLSELKRRAAEAQEAVERTAFQMTAAKEEAYLLGAQEGREKAIQECLKDKLHKDNVDANTVFVRLHASRAEILATAKLRGMHIGDKMRLAFIERALRGQL